MAGQLLPLEEGYVTVPTDAGEPPRLIGSYSPAADLWFFPRRRNCAVTLGLVEERLLSPQGTLYSFTFIYGPNGDEEGGYGVGQVDLPEGPRIQARLEGSLGDWHVGMPVRLVLIPVGVDEEDNTLVSFSFAPTHGTSA